MIVNMPDGTPVNFPDDMPHDQIKTLIASKYPDEVKDLPGAEELFRPAARAVRSGLAGLAGIADIGGAAVPLIKDVMKSGLEKAGVDFMGANSQYIPPSQGVKNIFDSLTNGIAKPRSDSEKVVDTANEFMAGGGAMKGIQKGAELLGQTPQILQKLAPQSAEELASLGAAGAGTQYAAQNTDNPIAEVMAGIVSALAARKAINTVKGTGDIKQIAEAAFNREAQRNPEANVPYFENQATKIIGKNIDESKIPGVKAELEKNPDLTLADIGGDEMRALTRQVGKMRGGARTYIDKFFTSRDREAAERISNLINSKVSGVDKYYTSLDEMASLRSKLAADQYSDVYAANKDIMTPEIRRVLNTPAGQSALKQAATKMQNDMSLMGVPDKELAEQAALAGEPIKGGVASGLNLRSLDYVKRALDDQIGGAYRAGENDNARILTGLKNQLVSALDEADKTKGGYKRARDTFSGFKSLEDAAIEGRNFKNKTDEQVALYLKDLTKGEKVAYKIGVRESLMNDIFNTGATASEANKIFGKAMQGKRLKVILGDEYIPFAKQMRKEIRKADTRFRVLGGSRTDYNIIEDDQFIQKATNMVKGGKVAVTNEIVNTLGDAIKSRFMGINPANSKILAKALTSNKGGIKILDDLIAKASPSQKKELQQFKTEYNYLLTPIVSNQNG